MDSVRLWMLSCLLFVVQSANDCPEKCSCSPMGSVRDHQNWHRAQSDYRLQWIMISKGRNHHSIPNATTPLRRRMTCIGLVDLPKMIPPDIQKITMYGDKEGYGFVQKDQAPVGHIDWDTTELDQAGHLQRTNQITNIDKPPQGEMVTDLFIEGNSIKRLPVGAFSAMNRLKTLSFRENRLSLIPPDVFRGLHELERADLSNNELVFLADMSRSNLPQLKSLLLHGNQIEEIYSTDFQHLVMLKELDLSANNIGYFEPNTFAKVRTLNRLNLSGNKLRYVSSQWFSRNIELSTIDLSNNRIGLIEGNSFSSMKNLEHLDLSGNNIGSIDADLFNELSSLQTLDLSRNRIAMVDDHSFGSLRNLETLVLSKNMISKGNSAMFSGLVQLKELRLNENQISEVSNEMLIEMPLLTSLDLDNNRIAGISAGTFTDMSELREIRLNHNSIKGIEDGAFSVSIRNNLSKIGWIFLSDNHIQTITSRTFEGTPYLRYLVMSSNAIDHIHKHAFRYSPNVIAIDLDNNSLSSIPDGLFEFQTSMTSLSLVNNKLNRLTENSFVGLHDLTDLSLNSNAIQEVDRETFTPLLSLRKLNLAQNLLPWFDMNILQALAFHLRYVDLSKNKIREIIPLKTDQPILKQLNLADNYLLGIEREITDGIVKGGHLSLSGNPWKCTCELSWLAEKYSEEASLFVHSRKVMCKTPRNMIGRQVFGLSKYELCNILDEYFTTTVRPTTVVTAPTIPTTPTTTMKPATLPTTSKAQTVPSTSLATTTILADLDAKIISPLLCDGMTLRNRTFRGRKLMTTWHASLVSHSGEILCTGARLTRDWVVFSATCLKRLTSSNIANHSVIIGSTNDIKQTRSRRHRAVHRYINHPEYSEPDSLHDVGLVHLAPYRGFSRLYMDDACIMPRSDLLMSIADFYKGKVTMSKIAADNFIEVTMKNAKLKSTLCGSDKYVCSRIINAEPEEYNLLSTPLYIRYGIGDSDWGLAGLTTNLQRTSKSGLSIIRKQLPLYAYVNWFDYIITQYYHW